MGAMLGTFVPAQKTTLSFDAAAFALRAALSSVLGERPSPPALALALAKTALETGRWRSMWNNNFGNVKHSEKREGLFTCIVLNEVIDGRVVWFAPTGTLTGNPERGGYLSEVTHAVPPGHPQTRMRAFQTASGGALDYVHFVSGGRYADAWQRLLLGDAEGYVRELKRRGYFTADEGAYLRGVESLQREFASRLMGMPEEETPVPAVDTVREWLSAQELGLLDAAFDHRRHQIADENRRSAHRDMSGLADADDTLEPTLVDDPRA